MYIVFDGMDGSGKGTQIKLLQEKFGDTAMFTREPGGTPFAEEIRKLVRDNPLAAESTALSNMLLFWAAREELQHNLIAPALGVGRHVFSDRGDSSTFAFQLYGEEQKGLIEMFARLRNLVFLAPHKQPDMYVIFDLSAVEARERALQDASREVNHFDARDLAYYERVREGFHEFGRHYPAIFIDAAQSPDEVHRDVLKYLPIK